MALAQHRAERRHREIGRPPEQNAHTLRLHLLPLAQQQLPLQRTDTVDEQNAIEVVDLVLQDASEQSLRRDANAFTRTVETLDHHRRGPLHDLLQSRDRQASFLRTVESGTE